MKININKLLETLVSHTVIDEPTGGSYTILSATYIVTISPAAKLELRQMQVEFKRMKDSYYVDEDKQANMIKLFIGSIICAIKRDYIHKKNNNYPQALSEVFKTVGANPSLEIMRSVGDQALLNLPQIYNEIFQEKSHMIFFQGFKRYAKNDLDLLVKFCIKHKENLNQEEVNLDELNTVDLKVPDTKAKTTDLNPVGLAVTDTIVETADLNSVGLAMNDTRAETADLISVVSPLSDEIEISPKTQDSSTLLSNTSMMVLGGFIAVVGVAAVALAVTVLSVVTLGLVGSIVTGLVAGIGAAAILTGAGVFAYNAYKKCQSTSDEADMMAPTLR